MGHEERAKVLANIFFIFISLFVCVSTCMYVLYSRSRELILTPIFPTSGGLLTCGSSRMHAPTRPHTHTHRNVT